MACWPCLILSGIFVYYSASTLLVGWQEGHPACKNWVVGCWRGYLSRARCQLFVWPSWCHCHLLFLAPLIPNWFLHFWYWLTRVVPEKRAVKRVHNPHCPHFTLPHFHSPPSYFLLPPCPLLTLSTFLQFSAGTHTYKLSSYRRLSSGVW